MDKELVEQLAPRITTFKIDDMKVMTVALKLIDSTDNSAISSGRFPKEEILDYHIYHACRICEYPITLSDINYKRKKENKQPLNLGVIEMLRGVISELEEFSIKNFPMEKYIERIFKRLGVDDDTRSEFNRFRMEMSRELRYRNENIIVAVCLYHAIGVTGMDITLEKIMRTLHVSRDGVRNLYKKLVENDKKS